jgi:hypothetical protein
MSMKRAVTVAGLLVWVCLSSTARGDSPWAAVVIDYSPAPGQFVQDPDDPECPYFNIPEAALGRPYAGGFADPDTSSLVTLGGFGGSLTLAFDHTVMNDPLNPHGMDFIVFGNAYYLDDGSPGGNPNRHWAECGHVEISRDINNNGEADDPWYLIPGSHITAPGDQYTVQTWDDDLGDATYPPIAPPADASWIPYGCSGTWTTAAYLLPGDVFNVTILENPLGPGATTEGIYGYADYAPVLKLGDIDGDNQVEEPDMLSEDFYTVPDDPLTVGITPGSGGGDALDIAWAIDPVTGEPAGLEGFDFIRVTTAVNYIMPMFNEVSTEIDAVADAMPDPFGDYDEDGDIDLADAAGLQWCFENGVTPPDPCARLDHEGNEWIDLSDAATFIERMTGPH